MLSRSVVKDSTQALYDVFSGYHCSSGFEQNKLARKKLSSLSHDDLYPYAIEALCADEANDFRYFLPRILELCTIDGKGSHWILFPIFQNLTNTDWITWPCVERVAVEKFLMAWWQDSLDTYPHIVPPIELLKAFDCAALNLSPFLTTWQSSFTQEAFQNFNDSFDALSDPKRFSKSAKTQLANWLFLHSTIDWLEKGYCQYSEEHWSDLLASNIDILSMQRPGIDINEP